MASALAALGPVLHVDCGLAALARTLAPAAQAPWPARAELAGLSGASSVCACVTVDNEGPRESLHFFDQSGAVLAAVWLLPDSDFLAWERLIEALPAASAQPPARTRWRRGALHGSARVCCLEHVRLAAVELLDMRAPARLSALGLGWARQIAAALSAPLGQLPVG